MLQQYDDDQYGEYTDVYRTDMLSVLMNAEMIPQIETKNG